MFPSPKISFGELRRRLRSDHSRLLQCLNSQGICFRKSAYLHPSFHAVLFFRLANYFQAKGYRWLGRIVWHFNLLWTGADISEHADIGEGFVVLHPAGVAQAPVSV
jgi:serine acetyltransferase